MRLAILTPIEEERDSIARAFDDRGLKAQEEHIGRLNALAYRDGILLLVEGGLGKAQFGVQAQHVLDNLEDVGALVCAGVAGALVSGISVRDVVVATATVEHDFNATQASPPTFKGHRPYISALRDVEQPPDQSFRLHFGPIASGDEGVADLDRAQAIHESTGALAVAWEGAGGARAAEFSEVPFLEV